MLYRRRPTVYPKTVYTKKKANAAATAKPKRLIDSEFEVVPLVPVLDAEAEAEAEAVGVEDRFSVVEAVASGSTVEVVAPDVIVELVVPVTVALSLLLSEALALPLAVLDDASTVVEQSSHVDAPVISLTHSAAVVVKLSK